ncbi:MAG: hypothetical protein JXQ69_03715 [Paludibacteraceae bacterium]|nr:hypothetical protein [Paludibacteraceae bacterium]
MKNKIIVFCKIHFPYILIISAILLFVFSGKINSCKEKKTESVIQAANVAMVRADLIDSIVSEAVNDTVSKLEEQIQARNIVINKRAEIIKNKDAKITKLTNDYEKALYAYKNDTTHTVIGDSLASISKKTVDEQKAQNDSLKNQVADIQKQADDYKQQASSLEYLVIQKDKTISANNQSIDMLTKTSKRTWWERNAKYFSFGFGVLLGSAVIR